MTRPIAEIRPAKRRRLPAVLGTVGAAAVLAGAGALAPRLGPGMEDAAVVQPPPVASTSAAPGQQPGKLIYTAGLWSVQLTVTNNTGHTMTWDQGSHSTGHWGQQPRATINDGDSDTVTAYTNENGFEWKLRWTLDNGDYACIDLDSAYAGKDDPHNISGAIYSNLDAFGECGDVDPAFENGGSESNSGGAHSWVSFTFAPNPSS